MALTLPEMLSELRLRIGDPDTSKVGDRVLIPFLNSGLSKLSALLEFPVLTGTMLLQANQQAYKLPDNCSQVIDVYWFQNLLRWSSVFQWDREGTPWPSPFVTPASNPFEVAIQGREMLFYPAPSASACQTAPLAYYTFFGVPSGVSTAGSATPDLEGNEQYLVIYAAATEYLGTHPLQDPTGSLLKTNAGELESLMGVAKLRRLQNPLSYRPRVSVWVGRSGPGR